MTDKEFVRAHWECITIHVQRSPKEAPTQWHGYVIADTGIGELLLASGTDSERWSAAAEFTRDRLEEIRQLRREADLVHGYVEYFSDEIAERICEDPVVIECAINPRDYATFARILARLERELAELTKGLKPPQL